MYKLKWQGSGKNEYHYWQKHDQAIVDRIKELLSDMKLHPFEGMGKPEPLKGNLHGYWSRRITQEHRLVYKVSGNLIIIYFCYGHYK